MHSFTYRSGESSTEAKKSDACNSQTIPEQVAEEGRSDVMTEGITTEHAPQEVTSDKGAATQEMSRKCSTKTIASKKSLKSQ